MNLKKIFLLVVLFFCGCLESNEPLCLQSQAFMDNSILGVWERSESDGSGTLEIKKSNVNLLKVLVKGHSLASPPEIDNFDYEGFICNSSNGTYINLKTYSVYDEQGRPQTKPERKVYFFTNIELIQKDYFMFMNPLLTA